MATMAVNTMSIMLFSLSFIALIIGFVISSTKCRSYRCSIKYGLPAGAVIGIAYSAIIFLFLVPGPQNVGVNATFSLSSFTFSLEQLFSNLSTGISTNTFLIISIISISMFINMSLGLAGSLIAIFTRENEVKSTEVKSTRRLLNKK